MKCLSQFIKKLHKETNDGIHSKQLKINNINGKINLHIFTIHHSFKVQKRNLSQFKILLMQNALLSLVILSLQIILVQLEKLLMIHQLQNICNRKR